MTFAITVSPQRTALIVMGPPASGKGTLGMVLATRGFEVISSGDLVRKAGLAATSGFLTARERRIRHAMLDEKVVALMVARLADSGSRHVMFDGFPRSVFHAAGLDCLLRHCGFDKERIHVLALRVKPERLSQRMHNRRRQALETGTPSRPEDNTASFARRLKAYAAYSAQVEGYYDSRVIPVDGNENASLIHARVSNLIGMPLRPKRVREASANDARHQR